MEGQPETEYKTEYKTELKTEYKTEYKTTDSQRHVFVSTRKTASAVPHHLHVSEETAMQLKKSIEGPTSRLKTRGSRTCDAL